MGLLNYDFISLETFLKINFLIFNTSALIKTKNYFCHKMIRMTWKSYDTLNVLKCDCEFLKLFQFKLKLKQTNEFVVAIDSLKYYHITSTTLLSSSWLTNKLMIIFVFWIPCCHQTMEQILLNSLQNHLQIMLKEIFPWHRLKHVHLKCAKRKLDQHEKWNEWVWKTILTMSPRRW